MNKGDGKDNLLGRIKAEHIKPLPPLYFWVQEGARWLILFMSVGIGAIALSVLLYAHHQADDDLLDHATHSRIELFLALAPVLWIVSLVAFSGLSIWLTRQTRRGYRFTWPKIILISILTSGLLGYACYRGGGAQWIDQQFFFSDYQLPSVENQKRKFWSNAEEGRLAGIIISTSDSLLVLKDLRDKEWIIDVSQALIRPRVDYQPGVQVKCLGHLDSQGSYLATEIRPWVGYGRHALKRNYE